MSCSAYATLGTKPPWDTYTTVVYAECGITYLQKVQRAIDMLSLRVG